MEQVRVKKKSIKNVIDRKREGARKREMRTVGWSRTEY